MFVDLDTRIYILYFYSLDGTDILYTRVLVCFYS